MFIADNVIDWSQYSGDAIVLPGSSANPQSRNSECRADLKGWLRRLPRTADVRSDREHNSPGRAGRSARASCAPPRPGSRAPNGPASRSPAFMAAMVAPRGRLSRASTAACLDLARVLWWTIGFPGFACDRPDRGFALV